ncbi:MAG: hypothetical protein ACFCU1_02100 [Sumerlaeia bacterium]
MIKTFPTFAFAILSVNATWAGPITIGPGPSIGFSGGIEYFEEFQDWVYDDCIALDAHGDSVNLGGGENARDLVALYFRDSPETSSVYFRVDVHDLFINAEAGSLDIYVIIATGGENTATGWPDGVQGSTNTGWNLAVALYDSINFNIYDSTLASLSNKDSNAQLFRGAYYRADLDAVEFGIDRQLLLDRGWDGASPLAIQAGTTRDFNSTLTDKIPNDRDARSDANVPTAKYAFVLHGNQAISPADYIQDLVYNTTIQTPNGRPTGYRRALETARVFKVPPTIHVSATLVSSALWAENPGEPNDGPGFVQEIADFLDGNAANGEGSVVWGVYSEHIMPFFEGQMNQDSIQLNEEYLQTVFGVDAPNENSTFWIPERVVRGSTFADLTATGYGWTILDQINHLKTWFGNEVAQGYKIHRINGVNSFMINDEPDRFKFANTDGGLWIDTRSELLELALAEDQEQLIVVFDDWEAYAGRSFLSFNLGTDNPDNFNTNIRWLANHPWIQMVDLEQVAGFEWTPIDQGTDINLPFETYDFLDHATEGSYENWYQGSDLEEDFDGYRPFIRKDLNTRTTKRFGALTTYNPSNGQAVFKGPGTIAQDVFQQTFVGTSEIESRLGRLSYSTATFETAWHDEDNGERCPDGTYCIPDNTFDNIAAFAKEQQFLNLRRSGGVFAEAAAWAKSNPTTTVTQAKDVDHDGEQEYLLFNENVLLVFENDGGKAIAGFAKNPADGTAVSLLSNLLGFPDTDDETEVATNGGRRLSSFVDWYAVGPDRDYVNDIYTFTPVPNGWQITSPDGNIQKTITLLPGDSTFTAAYAVSGNVSELYVRLGLAPDLNNLLETGQTTLDFSDDGQELVLENTATNQFVRVRYEDGDSNNASYNAAASDGTGNSPRNQAMIHMVELSGTGNFQFQMTFAGSQAQGLKALWMVY